MISVIVPTFDRPDSLRRAVHSLFAQTYAATGFAIIIVDNSPTGSAAAVISELQRACPESINLTAVSEPRPGVANARNAAMAVCQTHLVAFLDDDQSAPETWLATLLQAYEHTPAAVTFGPVETALPGGQTRHRAYFSAFFARKPDFVSGKINMSFGCGNALIDFYQIPGGAPWFDPKMNETGGEDDLLFARVRRADGDFAWAAEAPVFEHPLPERVTLNYTLRRAFSFGQAPISLALKDGKKRWDKVALWMLIGGAKFGWHGLQWFALSLIRHPGRAYQLDQAVRGFAKIVWWIDLKFYGAAAVKSAKPDPAAPVHEAPGLGDARRA